MTPFSGNAAMPFDDIIGHDRPISLLRGMLAGGTVPHALLLSGPRGIGKATAALAFVRALHCRELPDDCCDQCGSCDRFLRLVHPNLLMVSPEENVIKIAQVRAMQEQLGYRTVGAGRRAVIIDQAETLNSSAANCLLKTLEEPPGDTVLVLVAHETAPLLPTLLSRCQRIVFAPLSDADMQAVLERMGVEPEAVRSIAGHAQGSPGRALALLENDFAGWRVEVAGSLAHAATAGQEVLLDVARDLSARKDMQEETLAFLMSWYRDQLAIKAGVPEAALVNHDIAGDIVLSAARETPAGILKKINKLQRISAHEAFHPNMQLALESLLLE